MRHSGQPPEQGNKLKLFIINIAMVVFMCVLLIYIAALERLVQMSPDVRVDGCEHWCEGWTADTYRDFDNDGRWQIDVVLDKPPTPVQLSCTAE